MLRCHEDHCWRPSLAWYFVLQVFWYHCDSIMSDSAVCFPVAHGAPSKESRFLLPCSKTLQSASNSKAPTRLQASDGLVHRPQNLQPSLILGRGSVHLSFANSLKFKDPRVPFAGEGQLRVTVGETVPTLAECLPPSPARVEPSSLRLPCRSPEGKPGTEALFQGTVPRPRSKVGKLGVSEVVLCRRISAPRWRERDQETEREEGRECDGFLSSGF